MGFISQFMGCNSLTWCWCGVFRGCHSITVIYARMHIMLHTNILCIVKSFFLQWNSQWTVVIYRGWILRTSVRCHLCLAVTHKVSLTWGLCPLCVLYWFAFTRSMTCWRGYISRMAWDHLDVLPEKLKEMAGERVVWVYAGPLQWRRMHG